jgi:DNA-binding CsgD family transcriptional regulator
MDELSDQERAVVGLLASGLTAKLIADRLTLRPTAVQQHITTSKRKLGARNIPQLIATAMRER